MRLFVTGGTGFIGSHFVSMAYDAGHDVTVLCRDTSRYRVPLSWSPRQVTKSLDELSEADFWRHGQPFYDAIIHLAAHTANHPYDTLDKCLYWNAIAPLKMFCKAAEAGISKFVVAGSYFEYGHACNRYLNVPPSAPLEPSGTYPISKATASMAFIAFAKEAKVRLSIHRIFQTYGDGEAETRLWPSLRRAAMAGEDFQLSSSGDQIRDFVPVTMVANQLLGALSLGLTPGRPMIENVGTGLPMTVRQFVDKWWSEWKATGKIQYGPLESSVEMLRCVPIVGESYTL